MCRRTTCKQCGKPSWAGCGAHVEQVLGDVPTGQRCSCRETGRPAAKPVSKSGATKSSSSSKSGAVAPAEPATAMAKFKAWLKQ